MKELRVGDVYTYDEDPDMLVLVCLDGEMKIFADIPNHAPEQGVWFRASACDKYVCNILKPFWEDLKYDKV